MLRVKCCVGSSCHIRGGAKTLKALNALIEEHNLEGQVELVADLCLENCVQAPNIMVDGVVYGGITPDQAEAFFMKHILERVS